MQRIAKLQSAISLAALSVVLSTQRALGACELEDAQSGADCAKGNLSGTELTTSIGNITNLLITAIGIISVIMIIIGGFRYALSGGDQKATTAAKDTILYAVIGLVVALLAYTIANFVINQF